ncbi:hypothetical protein UlMin_002547 [Ulmus minor]
MFILEHIICRFGVPRRILTYNGTPFVGKETKKLLDDYKIHHGTSTCYYPQGNGKVEAFNKTIIKILSKAVQEHVNRWHEYLSLALWAYRTSQILIPSTRLMLEDKEEEVMISRLVDLEVIEERRQEAQNYLTRYTHKMQRAYDKKVRVQNFQLKSKNIGYQLG